MSSNMYSGESSSFRAIDAEHQMVFRFFESSAPWGPIFMITGNFEFSGCISQHCLKPSFGIAYCIALHWLLHIILISRCFLGVGCHVQTPHLQIVGSNCADYHVPDLSLWVGIVICSRKMLLYQLWYDRLATFTIFSARRGQIDAND